MILLNGRNEGMWFEPPMKGTRKRKTKPTCVVLHHTAGEGGANQVFRTLKNRGLSIHFVIDNDGRITCMADMENTVCYHAEDMNETSIGVEIVNRGTPPAMESHLREVYSHDFRGTDRNFLAFYPQQIQATWDLLRIIYSVTGIPLQWPVGQEVIAAPIRAGYSGILGHHHVKKTKVDPSPHIWDAISQLAQQKAVSVPAPTQEPPERSA